MSEYQRSITLLNKNVNIPPPPAPAIHPSMQKSNQNYERQMEERILKIMKDAEAQRMQEEQKTKKVLKEMQ
jgi:hypothetical protein